jgi:TRAP-type mannitol/chloroaromatic compound transport system permease large subunit
MGGMARTTARFAAVQIGEFAVGMAVAYVAVGAAWAATAAVWAPLVVAAALVALAIAIELRFGPKATGLVAGMLPTAVVTAGLLAAMTLVLARLSS